MDVKISKIQIDERAIIPTLTIDINISFVEDREVPICISGRMFSENTKILSRLNEYSINTDKSYELRIISQEKIDDNYAKKKNSNYFAQLTAELSPKAIEHIELHRERCAEKSVKLSFEFLIKHIDVVVTSDQLVAADFLKFRTIKKHDDFTIPHSDWINKYSTQLGIGKFMLLELRIPEDKNVSKFWCELYSQLTENLQQMESCLRNGDWNKAMLYARRFYENAKIGDNKPAHKKFKEEFNKLMLENQHSQDAINDLYDGIYKFFEFISKYIHDKDKLGNLRPAAISTKEDAYFAYTLGIGLLNLIGKKISAD